MGLAAYVFLADQPSEASQTWVWTTPGTPSTPTPWNDPDWDVTVHYRDIPHWLTPPLASGQHGPNCEAPDVEHPVTTYEGTVYNCRSHVMTATGPSGYSATYLMPNRMVDFSQGEAVIRWRMSTWRTSTRDWVDLWITPFGDHLQAPLQDWLPDLNGEPSRAVHVTIGGNTSNLCATVYRNHAETSDAPACDGATDWHDFLEPSKSRRDLFEVRISRTRLSVCMPEYNFCWVDGPMPDLGWDAAVVQWGHHVYSPDKGEAVDGPAVADTWHWSDFQISPARPFTLIKSDRRYITNLVESAIMGDTLTFDEPAPSNAYLRFMATIEQKVEFSIDGGKTWTVAQKPNVEREGASFVSYLTPIPRGAQTVKFRSTNWWACGCWFVKDASIVSESTPDGSLASTISTATPTATPAAAPTSTTSQSPGAVTAPQETSTPAATQTPAPSTTSPASTLSWHGQSWNVTGVNMPWYNWACDFGCGGSRGVSDPAVRDAIDARFAELAATGAHVVRWWMFEGDAWQVQRDASGKPTGLDSRVFADVDAALALADKYDLYFTFMLFNAEAIPRSWLTDPSHRQALAEVLGTQLFARYASNPRILSWEVFNEPEFAIWDGRIPEQDTVSTAKAIVDAIHANSSALATVGSAMLDGLYMWVGAGLDYYQAHWYDYMSSGGWCARCTNYQEVSQRFGLDAPLVIGEFYAGATVDAEKRFTDFFEKGYAGAWAWSLFADRTSDKMAVDMLALKGFVTTHPSVGPKSSGTSSGSTTPTGTTPDGGFELARLDAPASVLSGDVATLTANVRNDGPARDVLIDIEVYGPQGTKVGQGYIDGVTLGTGETFAFTYEFTAPSVDTSTRFDVKVGVFEPGWTGLVEWFDSAGALAVDPSSEPTPTPAPDEAPTVAITSVTPTYQRMGRTVSVDLQLATDAGSRTVFVRVELLDGTASVAQWSQDNVTVTESGVSLQAKLRPPRLRTNATYSVKVSIFEVGGGGLLLSRDAGDVTVPR